MAFSDKQHRSAEEAAEYWKNAYFDLIFKRGSYVNWLMKLNESLRLQLHNREVEIQKYDQWVRKVGNTTICSSSGFPDGTISNGRFK